MEIIVKKPLGLDTLASLALDAQTLARARMGVVTAVKESFGDAEVMSKQEANRRMECALRFVLRCVGDGMLTVSRALALLPTALPVELTGLEYPIPTRDVYRAPDQRRGVQP